MSSRPKLLSSSFKLGRIVLKNRIVFLPHNPCLGENNLPSEKQAYYFTERAKGGVGLIVMGSQVVHPSGTWEVPGGPEVWNFDDRVIPGYKRITSMVHEQGTPIVCQLAHFGAEGMWPGFGWGPAWSPSGIASPTYNRAVKAMEAEEIRELIGAFASAAVRCRQGGFDGIELKVAHNGLLRQFLSPYFNRRTDGYGGSHENRIRLLMEVISAVREGIGREPLLGIRLTMDELYQGGYTLEDGKIFARILSDSGMPDYISVDAGTDTTAEIVVPPMSVPPGFALSVAAAAKEVCKIPIVGYGRINDPFYAEKLLEDGYCDLIGMARALIADPELPRKAFEGQMDLIRPCLGCNQNCISSVYHHLPLGCVHNPAAGREKDWGAGTLSSAPLRKRVVVVGGGPAGLKFTEVALKRGHEVILLEAKKELGGQARLASLPPNRQEFFGAVRYLEIQLRQLKADIRSGTEADEDMVLGLRPDAVVIATGATHYSPESYGSMKTITPPEVLEAPEAVGRHAILVDEDRHWIAAGMVEFLSSREHELDVVFKDLSFAPELETTLDRPYFLRRMAGRRIAYHPQSSVKRVEGSTVILEDIYSGEEEVVQDVDTMVYAGFRRPREDLYFRLKGRVKEIYRIGDCAAPRRLDSSIFEGEKLARAI